MRSSIGGIEILKLRPELVEPLACMLEELQEAGDEPDFHPHPFTENAIREILSEVERDHYYVVVESGAVLAYGMLRGWDDGFETPSLGIAVSPSARGQGIGLILMRFLHFAAKRAGADKVRLTVNASNESALRLYEGLGYTFEPLNDRLVGFLSLQDSA